MKEFVEKLHIGHFANTTDRTILEFSIKRIVPSSFYVKEECIMNRKGNGRDETGPGVYHYDSSGYLNVFNKKIIKIDYTFKKTFMAPLPSVDNKN